MKRSLFTLTSIAILSSLVFSIGCQPAVSYITQTSPPVTTTETRVMFTTVTQPGGGNPSTITVTQTVLVTPSQPQTTSPNTTITTETSAIGNRLQVTYNGIPTAILKGCYPENPNSGFVFIVVDMTIENQGYNSVELYPYASFEVVVDNYYYGTETVLYLAQAMPGNVKLINGGILKGKLVFEVPQSAKVTSFQVVANFMLDKYVVQLTKNI